MSRQKLQATIDESMAKASGFTRELFEDKHMNATELEAFANESGGMTVATLDREGKPHAAVVAAGCSDGTLYIGVTPRSALLGNLRRDDDVAFTIKDNVTGRGHARLLGRAGEHRALAPSMGPILRAAIEQGWNGYLYVIEPTRIFAQAA